MRTPDQIIRTFKDNQKITWRMWRRQSGSIRVDNPRPGCYFDLTHHHWRGAVVYWLYNSETHLTRISFVWREKRVRFTMHNLDRHWEVVADDATLVEAALMGLFDE